MAKVKEDAIILNVKLTTPVYDQLEEVLRRKRDVPAPSRRENLRTVFNDYFERPANGRTIIQHGVKEWRTAYDFD